MSSHTDPLPAPRPRRSRVPDVLRRPFEVMSVTPSGVPVADQLKYRRQTLLHLILVTLGVLLALILVVFALALLFHRVTLAPHPAGDGNPPPLRPGGPPPGQGGPPPGDGDAPPPGRGGPPPPMSIFIPLEPIAFLGMWLLLTVLAYVLNRRGNTLFASMVYVYGLVGLTGVGLCLFSSLDAQSTALIFTFIALIFIVLTGLLLPAGHIWSVATLNALLLVVASFIFPYDTPLLLSTLFFVVIFLVVAVLTWIFARVAGASVQSIILTLKREQELAGLEEQFIISANHELRTPIMAMYGSLELLQTFGSRIEEEKRQRILERGMRAGRIVQEMLNTLMEVTVTEATHLQLHVEPIDVRQQVLTDLELFDPGKTSEAHTLAALAKDHHIALDIPPNLTVLADQQKLRQILLNLLTNAVKYSAAGTKIVIAARMSAHRSGFVEISVSDQGLGIPPDQVKLLFQRFSRLKRDIGGAARGTGLGLYLTKMFVEAMGGHIWVTSSGIPGEGSTFHFVLPLGHAPILPTTRPRREPALTLPMP